MKKIILVLSIAVLTSCGNNGTTDSSSGSKGSQVSEIKMDTGVKVALEFINRYVKNSGIPFADNPENSKHELSAADWVKSNNLSTKSFKKEFKRLNNIAAKDPDSGLDADLIFDAQDFPEKGFEPESFDEKTGYLTVKGIGWPAFRLTMKIKMENGKWLVDGCGMVNIPEDKRAKR